MASLGSWILWLNNSRAESASATPAIFVLTPVAVGDLGKSAGTPALFTLLPISAQAAGKSAATAALLQLVAISAGDLGKSAATPSTFTLLGVNAKAAGKSASTPVALILQAIAAGDLGKSAASAALFALTEPATTAAGKSAATPALLQLVPVNATGQGRVATDATPAILNLSPVVPTSVGRTNASPVLFGIFIAPAKSDVVVVTPDDRTMGGSAGPSAGYGETATPTPAVIVRRLFPKKREGWLVTPTASGASSADPASSRVHVARAWADASSGASPSVRRLEVAVPTWEAKRADPAGQDAPLPTPTVVVATATQAAATQASPAIFGLEAVRANPKGSSAARSNILGLPEVPKAANSGASASTPVLVRQDEWIDAHLPKLPEVEDVTVLNLLLDDPTDDLDLEAVLQLPDPLRRAA